MSTGTGNVQQTLFLESLKKQPPNNVYTDKTFADAAGIDYLDATDNIKTVENIKYYPILACAIKSKAIETFQGKNARAYAEQHIKENLICENNIYVSKLPFSVNLNDSGNVQKYAMDLVFVQESTNYSVVLVTKQVFHSIHVLMHQLLQKQNPQGVCGTVRFVDALGIAPDETATVKDKSKIILLKGCDDLIQRVLQNNIRSLPLTKIRTVSKPPQLVFELDISGINVTCRMRNGGLFGPSPTGNSKRDETKPQLFYHLFFDVLPPRYKYYILLFDNNEEGERLKEELSHVPNGTSFEGPMHRNRLGNWWALWASTCVEKRAYAGATLIATDITKRIIASDITHDDPSAYFDDIFQPYVKKT